SREKIDALKPPVAEQLGVERGRHNRVGARAPARRRLAQHAGKMSGVIARAAQRRLRVVLLLGAEIHAGTGDAPEPESVRPANLVELEVPFVAGIALITAPDLLGRFRITHEREQIASGAVR